MLTNRESASLDRYITGNYGEDQFEYEEHTVRDMSVHEEAFYLHGLPEVFTYDSAEDGPEVEIIKGILASQPLYVPGKEGELLRFQDFVNRVARHMYGDRYGRLGAKRKTLVYKRVIKLHTGDLGLRKKKGFAWTL